MNLPHLDLGKTIIFIDCLFLMVVNIPFFSVLRSGRSFKEDLILDGF